MAKRIKSIFEQLKTDAIFKEVFAGNEQISLSDYGVAYVASEIAKYSFWMLQSMSRVLHMKLLLATR